MNSIVYLFVLLKKNLVSWKSHCNRTIRIKIKCFSNVMCYFDMWMVGFRNSRQDSWRDSWRDSGKTLGKTFRPKESRRECRIGSYMHDSQRDSLRDSFFYAKQFRQWQCQMPKVVWYEIKVLFNRYWNRVRILFFIVSQKKKKKISNLSIIRNYNRFKGFQNILKLRKWNKKQKNVFFFLNIDKIQNLSVLSINIDIIPIPIKRKKK